MPKYEIDPEQVRKMYCENLLDVRRIAEHFGCTAANIRRILKINGWKRGYRAVSAGRTLVPNKGKRDPNAKRNQPKAKFMSEQHREKLSRAKRGRFGEQANNWQGGTTRGGALVYSEHRRTVDGRRMYAHRAVAEEALGRRLGRSEHVHHIDRDRSNNRPENLIVLHSSDHLKLHRAINESCNSREDQLRWLANNNVKHEVLV